MPRKAKWRAVEAADVRAYLVQSEEYLASARDDLHLERFNAATSAAIHAGINAADPICGALLGKRSAGGDHAEAVDLLKQAGADGKAAATQLTRLIPLKSQAEYDPSPVSRKRAEHAVRAAERLVDIGHRVIAR